MSQLKIDGVDYDLEGASSATINQYESLVASASDLEGLKQKLASTYTARLAYQKDLSSDLSTIEIATEAADNGIEIDGRWYLIAAFPEEDNFALQSIRACDNRITFLKIEIAITETAVSAYRKALIKEIGTEKIEVH